FVILLSLLIHLPPSFTLFPYTTLFRAAHLHTEIVDPRYHYDDKRRQRLCCCKREFLVPNPPSEKRRVYRWEKETHEADEASSQPRHGDKPVQKRTHPSEQEAPKRPQAAAQVDVRAPRAWKSRPQFGVTECPQQNHKPAENPRHQHQSAGSH